MAKQMKSKHTYRFESDAICGDFRSRFLAINVMYM